MPAPKFWFITSSTSAILFKTNVCDLDRIAICWKTADGCWDRFLAQHFADCIDLVEVRQAVEFGEPFRNIVRKAAEEGVDMIVMSTHGRTGIDRLMWGSIAEKVVAHAPCAVVVVPRRGREIGTAKAA